MESNLRRLQEQFAALLLAPERRNDSGDALAIFALPSGVSTINRLRVYASGYPARMEESLRENFPALAHVLGARRLHSLLERYVAVRPPRSYSLDLALTHLPEMLRGDPLAIDLPFLPDLVALEWHITRAFHAASGHPVDSSTFAGWTEEQWEGAVLRFQSWVSLIHSEWPIHEIWAARETPLGSIDIDLQSGPVCILVRRNGFDVECEPISETEASTLEALLEGRSLGEVTQTLASTGDDPNEVGKWFSRWLSQGLIAACELVSVRLGFAD